MTHDEKLLMVLAMERYGGGFVQALAECFMKADRINQAKLEAAFPEYVKEYRELAQKELARA